MKPRAAFDFETSHWTRPIAIGFAWPDGKTTFAKDPFAAIIAVETMLANPQYDFWAHNMGRFDGLILAEAANAMGVRCDASMSGGGIVSLTLRKGKSAVKVYDSYRVVPASLASAAVDFDLPSRKLFTQDDYSRDASTWPLERLREGCLVDCKLVLELLDKVESYACEWSGALKATFSSTALSCVRGSLAKTETSLPVHAGEDDLVLQDYCRDSYLGARVEVFRHFPAEALTEWDVASSYPASMSEPMPWEPIGRAGIRGIEAMLAGSHEGCIDAEVDVPETEYPCLPYSREGGIYFPWGEWRGIFTACELRYALSLGVTIKRLYEGTLYTKADPSPFKQVISQAYKLKIESKGAARQFAKYFLNGCYGKFAQRPDHETLVQFATEDDCEAYALKHDTGDNIRELSPRALGVTTHRIPKHAHYCIGSYITALSRIRLHKGMLASKGLAYVDTDSLHATSYSGEVSNTLGAFKVEASNYRAEFYAPKLYRMRLRDGSQHVVCKGFPVDPSIFDKIIAGETIEVERSRLARSQFRTDATFRRVKQTRSWKGISRKRRIVNNGETIAWNVSDLIANKHLTQRLTLPR